MEEEASLKVKYFHFCGSQIIGYVWKSRLIAHHSIGNKTPAYVSEYICVF